MSEIKTGADRYFEYDCWLGFRKPENSVVLEYLAWSSQIVTIGCSKLLETAAVELSHGIKGLLGIVPQITKETIRTCGIILGIVDEAAILAELVSESEIDKIQEEGFLIKSIIFNGSSSILIAGKSGRGILYGAFALLRLMQLQTKLEGINILDNPVTQLRMINQWDNMDGTIERGYAGASIFYKDNDFYEDMNRVKDYARLLASVGINGLVLNNVNVHKTETTLISEKMLPKVARLADILRDYGIKTYLSINYSSPIELGKLDTADPLDEGVKKWWSSKAEEIYSHINDFGGFLVKADSEFRPGPFTYGRNHAEGANVLAEALEPFGGIVIWRCFVYNCKQDWRDYKTDRANAAYDNFMPLDGLFKGNVILQIKNGPMDFQVREPVSPLLGGLERTNQILELQITQEYTGQQKHLCYLVPQWKEVFNFDTYAKGEGSTIKDIINGSVFKMKYSGVAAVSNIGNNVNWTGHTLAQANLYGYGRLIWNPGLSSEEIAKEWIQLTFSNNEKVVATILEMLLSSWKIYEDYTSPLGIGWMVSPNHHYGPSVDGYEYQKWGTYHRADWKAIGVDRTSRAGTGFASRYRKENTERFEAIDTCPEELLLFFHRVPYDYKLRSGVKLIQHIYNTHFQGAKKAVELKDKWESLKGLIDEERYESVRSRLEIQIEDAKEWRDVINSYFYRKTGIEDELGRKIY